LQVTFYIFATIIFCPILVHKLRLDHYDILTKGAFKASDNDLQQVGKA
jgi:hypothetical protein